MVDWKLVVPVLDKWKDVLGEQAFTLDELADMVLAVATNPYHIKRGSEEYSTAIEQCVKAVLPRLEYYSWYDVVVVRVARFNEQRWIDEMNQEETNLIMQWEQPTAARINSQLEQQPTSAAETVISIAAAASMVYPSVDEQQSQRTANEIVMVEPTTEHEQQTAAYLCTDHVVVSAVCVVTALITAFVLESSGFADSRSAATHAGATAAAIQQTIDSSAACNRTQQQQNAVNRAAVSAYAVAMSSTASSVTAFPYDPGGRNRVFDPGGPSCSLLLIGDTFHTESVAGSQLSTQRHQLPSHASSWARKDPTDTAVTSSRGMSLLVN